MHGDDETEGSPSLSGEGQTPRQRGQGVSRRYTYLGKSYPDPNVHITIGDIKFRPWAMTDAEIDKLLERAPALRRLWKEAK